MNGYDRDRQVLNLVASLIGERNGDAMLVQSLWQDRAALVESLVLIRDWDLGHAEALSVERVQSIVRDALLAVGES